MVEGAHLVVSDGARLPPAIPRPAQVPHQTGPQFLSAAWSAFVAEHKACEAKVLAATKIYSFSEWQETVGLHQWSSSDQLRAVLGVDRARNCARHTARPPPPPRFVEQSVAAQPVPVPVTAPGGEKKDKWKAWVEHWRSMRAQQRDGTLQLGAQPKQKSDVIDP